MKPEPFRRRPIMAKLPPASDPRYAEAARKLTPKHFPGEHEGMTPEQREARDLLIGKATCALTNIDLERLPTVVRILRRLGNGTFDDPKKWQDEFNKVLFSFACGIPIDMDEDVRTIEESVQLLPS